MTDQSTRSERSERASTRAIGEPRLAAVIAWAMLGAGFALSWATWVAIARIAGYGMPIRAIGLRADLSWALPVLMDGWVVVSLLLWLAPVPDRIARFARRNTYAAACVGMVAQSGYHGMSVWTATGQLWRATLATVTGALVPLVVAIGVHVRTMIHREIRAIAPIASSEHPIASPQSIASAEHPSDRPAEHPSTRTDRPIAQPIRASTPAEHPGDRPGAVPDQRVIGHLSTVPPIAPIARHNGAPIARKPPTPRSADQTTERLAAIRSAFPDWETNPPSTRAIARTLGCSASTGAAYLARLREQEKVSAS